MTTFTPTLPSPLVDVHDERFDRAKVRLLLKRDDLIHHEITGNKWRKLKYNIEAAKIAGATTLLTFGGAYSNHLRAVAAAGHYFGFRTIGLVRGEEHLPLNDSLSRAVGRGMELHYVDRTTYRRKHTDEFVADLRQRFGDFYLVPEGGSNSAAVRGAAELVDELTEPHHVICCPCGTGGTLAGIAGNLPEGVEALGFSALKGDGILDADIARMQRAAFGLETGNWSIDYRFHFGGFAKRTQELDDFIIDFERRNGVFLEWIYVAKMMFGIFESVRQGRFAEGATIVAVVTGPAE